MSQFLSRAFETLSADQVALVNEACDRFEQVCRQGGRPDIQEHLPPALVSVRQVLLRELILIDAAYRRKAGEMLDTDVYKRLLPGIDLRSLAENTPTAASLLRDVALADSPHLSRYEVIREIGRGGMGVVYQARDLRLGRLVCLKSLPSEAWGRPERLARLRREARALSSLNHPNICTIHELEEQDGIPCLVFEWVDGKTFREVALEGDCLSRLYGLFLQTARALAAAHAAGIVHRDMKPENLMIRHDGVVKVLDFGLARLDDAELQIMDLGEEQTTAGALIGTARYMSPEQALGRQATAASDIFSLGIVLYELATGRRPFSGGHMAAVLNAIVEVDPEFAGTLNPLLDPRVGTLIDRMLDKRPEARPTSAEVVAVLGAAGVEGEEASIQAAVGSPVDAATLVGREAELRELWQVFTKASASHGQAVFVGGEPGIGKTTLLEHFINDLRQRQEPLVLHGRCSPRPSAADAYLPVLDALARAMDGPEGSVVGAAIAEVAPAWRALTASSTDALGQVSAEGGQLSSGRLKREFRALLVALSQRRVVLFLLDDLHWADESTIDLLAHVGQDLCRMPVMLLGAYRPTDAASSNHPFECLRSDSVGRGWGRDMVLPFLDRDEVAQFLERQFPDHDFPDSFAESLHQRTEGSPLFLKGLVRFLRERGAIQSDGRQWTVAEISPALKKELPSSIASLIASLLRGVAEEDRRILQAASVQGVEFDAAVVADALQSERADVEDRFQNVWRQHGLIGPGAERELQDGTLTHRHRFIHVLYQEALYAELTPARRAAWSLQIAQVLERIHVRRPDEIARDLAFLYEAGRDFWRAIACLQSAAQRDVRIGACREAATACHRGLELIAKIPPSPDRDQKELALQFACGFAESLARGYGSRESLLAYQRAETLCLRQPAAAEGFWVLHGLWSYYLAKMDAEKLVALGNRLVDFAGELASVPHAYAANSSHALALLHLGKLEQVEERLRLAESSGSYSPEDDHRFIAQMCMPFGPLFHCTRSWLRQLQGDSAEALAEAQLAVEWGETLGTPQFQVDSWYSLLHYLRRDAEQAFAWAGRTLEFARRTGFESYRRTGAVIEAWAAVELAAGERSQVADILDAALAVASAQRKEGIRASTPVEKCMIGEALAKLSRTEEAQAAFADSLAYGRESGERWWEAETLRQMGLLQERALGDTARAADLVREGLDLAQAQGAKLLEVRCRADLSRLGWNLPEN